MKKVIFFFLAMVFTLASTFGEARVIRIEITRVESPTFEGMFFHGVGQYEKLVGRFFGELDPDNPLNKVITDIEMAPKDTNGKVEYTSDFYILRPITTGGNGALFFEFGNRGNKGLLSYYNDSVSGGNDPTTSIDAGTGFLMQEGFTLVWCGILADVQTGSGGLTLQVPISFNTDGTSIIETIWDECTFFADTDRCTFSYEVPEAYRSEAVLYVRERRNDPPVMIPNSDWTFDGSKAIKLTGSPFRKGFIYQFIRKAANPPIMAIGYAAARDWVSFLRYSVSDDFGNANPLTGLRTFLAFGDSQTGRFMRDYIYYGFNEEESGTGKLVFDGMDIHNAATRLFMNIRFAQPTRRADFQHEDLYYSTSAFPFAYEDQTDPYSGKTDGILQKCTTTGTCPKLMHTTTSLEFWQSKNSLVLTDPLGTQDNLLPSNVRVYTFTGGQHLPNRGLVPEGVCEQPSKIMDYRPLLRSILVALEDWTVSGILPPNSRHAKIEDGTLVPPENVNWPPIPGATFAGPVVNQGNIYDYGPLLEQGIMIQVLPSVTENKYQVLVPQVDSDGIDIAGIRLPVVSVPLATRTGWAVWDPGGAAGGELCNQEGSYIPFPATKAERVATNDPRLSIEERYPTHGAYISEVSEVVNDLVKARLLLEEDAENLKKGVGIELAGSGERRYFTRNGQPLLSFGGGCDSTFDLSDDAFNFTRWADWAAAHGMNHLRVYPHWGYEWTTSYTLDGGGALSKMIFPYVETSPGSRQFNLDQFNATYWTRFRQRCQYMQSKGIVIHLLMLNGWEADSPHWAKHYFNPANNVNAYTDHLAGAPAKMYSSVSDGQTGLVNAQKKWFRKLIDVTYDLDNVYYDLVHEIANHYEDWGKTQVWIDTMAKEVRNYWATKTTKPIVLGMDAGGLDDNLGANTLPTAGSKTDWVYSRSYFDLVIFGKAHHVSNAREWRKKYGKPYIPQESWDDSNKKYSYRVPNYRIYLRKYFWKFMMAKCQQMDTYYRSRNYPGATNPPGPDFNYDPNGWSQFENDARKLHAFWKALTDYPNLWFTGSVLSGPGRHKYVLSSSKEAVAYCSSGTTEMNKSFAASVLKLRGLALADGSYTADIWSPGSGKVSTQSVTVSRGALNVSLPSFTDDIVVHVHGGGVPS